MSTRGQFSISLVSYQLRPLRPLALALGLVGVWLVGCWMIPAGPPPPPLAPDVGDVTLPLALISITLGAAIAFVIGRDVDTSESLLFSLPYSFWRTLALRSVLWVASALVVVSLLAARGAGMLSVDPTPLRNYALVFVVLSASLTLPWARVLGSLFGGAGGLVTVLALAAVSVALRGFPLRLFAAPGSERFVETSGRLWLVSAVVFAAVFRGLRRPARGGRVSVHG